MPGQDEEEDGDAEVGRHPVDPDVQGEGREEGEEVGRLLHGLLEEDAHAQVHEGGREVHALLPLVRDGQVGDGQVRFLEMWVSIYSLRTKSGKNFPISSSFFP